MLFIKRIRELFLRAIHGLHLEIVVILYKHFSSFIVAAAPRITSVFQGSLTTSSQLFVGLNQTIANYRYQAVQINVVTTNTYNFFVNTTYNFEAYLYSPSFSAINPYTNLLQRSDLDGPGTTFSFTVTLTVNVIYVLVVTTYVASSSGPYTIIGTGPGVVSYVDISASTG